MRVLPLEPELSRAQDVPFGVEHSERRLVASIRASDDCAERRLDRPTGHAFGVFNLDRDRIRSDETVHGAAGPIALVREKQMSDRYVSWPDPRGTNERWIKPT